jgi:hypothetical protein
MYEAKMTAKLGMRGTIECRNARGEVVKTIEFSGSLPIDQVGITEQEARKLVEQSNGSHE